jgi:hypothetical protein
MKKNILYIFVILLASNLKAQTIDFMDVKISVVKMKNCVQLNKINKYNSTSENEIDFFIKEINNCAYEDFFNSLLSAKLKYKLNDFLFISLIKNIALEFYPKNIKNQKLFVWYTLEKSDFNAFIQYSNRQIIVFCAFNNLLDNVLYTDEDNIRYYDVFYQNKIFNEEMYVYRLNKQKKQKNIFFDVYDFSEVAKNNILKCDINFSNHNIKYKTSFKVNKSLINFLDSLPNFELGKIYTNSHSVSSQFNNSIITNLKTQVNKLDTITGINFLLKLCQNIKYLNDSSKWKQEKYLFPEQTLFYNTGDCDDKSILFSYLVNQLYQIKSVGIIYNKQNHINVGLLFKGRPEMKTILFNGLKYIVCEPTTDESFEIGTCQNNLDFKNIKIVEL